MAVSCKGAHFPTEIILMGVRWSVAYPLSIRHGEERMAERGVERDHATINRWVITYSPPLEEAFHRRQQPVWVRWHLDETSICNGLQSKPAGTAISAFSGPHSLHLLPCSGPHDLQLRLQSSAEDCNPSRQDHIRCN